MPDSVLPDLVVQRASNGFLLKHYTATGGTGRLTIATTVEELLEHVRSWATPNGRTPPRPKRSKH